MHTLPPIDFTVTPSDHGPVVRVSVEELARATGLDVQPHYGALVDRACAIGAVALAGGAPAELRALDAASAAALKAPVSARTAPVASPAPVAHVAPVVPMRPRHEPAAAPTAPLPTRYAEYQASEREAILAALNATGWNKVKAARVVGLARRTFYRRLEEYGLMERPAESGTDPSPAPAPAPQADPVARRPRARHPTTNHG